MSSRSSRHRSVPMCPPHPSVVNRRSLCHSLRSDIHAASRGHRHERRRQRRARHGRGVGARRGHRAPPARAWARRSSSSTATPSARPPSSPSSGHAPEFVAGDATTEADNQAAVDGRERARPAAHRRGLRGRRHRRASAPCSATAPRIRSTTSRPPSSSTCTPRSTRCGSAPPRWRRSTPSTRTATRGVVITTASIAGFEGQIGQISYGSAKAAIIGMTLIAARDLAAVGVRVNSIAPGTIATRAWDGAPASIREPLEAKVPFPRRFGHAQEFADLVEHLVDQPVPQRPGHPPRRRGPLRPEVTERAVRELTEAEPTSKHSQCVPARNESGRSVRSARVPVRELWFNGLNGSGRAATRAWPKR